jgi:hypothetical protein
VFVNKESRTFDPAAKTWGELLVQLDDACGEEGRIVTAARLDGVDEPSFRHPDVGTRQLDGLAVIEVDAVPPMALLTDSLREAAAGLDSLCAHALEVAGRFRGHELHVAQQGLVELAQGLQVLTSLIATIGVIVQKDLASLTWNGEPATALVGTLGTQLETLIEAQQNQDWLTVADVMEYDIEPALRACRPLFDALGASAQPLH